MIEKVNENPIIYRLKVPLPKNPLKYVNSYVLPDGERPCIIDTGVNHPEFWDALEKELEELEINLHKTDLFITHLHSNHSSLANVLLEKGCTIYMNPEDHHLLSKTIKGEVCETMEDTFYEEGFPKNEMELQKKNNHRKIYSSKEIFPIIPVYHRDLVHLAGRDFIAINTPGHTKGHTCLYLPEEEIMFTGDHILFDITPSITPCFNMENALKEYMWSLDKISRYSVKKAFPAHSIQKKAFKERIKELQENHIYRLREVYSIVRKNPYINAYKIASKLTWSMGKIKFKEFTPSQKLAALEEVIAHLDYLLDNGSIKKTTTSGIYRYYLPCE